jgi:DNA primase catalytic core
MDIKDTLKDTITIEEVIKQLGISGLTNQGGNLQGPCPTGHASTSKKCFVAYPNTNSFYCFNCQIGGNIFNLVMEVRGVDFIGALRWITETFRQDLLPELSKYKGEVSPTVKEYAQKASIYELVYQYGKDLLYKPEGKEALDYLTQRGYTEENLKQTDWIYYPPEKDIKAYILKQQPEVKEELNKVSLQGVGGDLFRLATPYRDRWGNITGFAKRATSPEGVKVGDNLYRWSYTAGLTKPDLFNLNRCRREQTLVIVEGIPDALYLPTLGLKNVVAITQGALGDRHIEGLQAFGVKRVILALDNEETGLKNTEAAIDKLKGTGINVFVVDPNSLGRYKDPDLLAVNEGIGAFETLIDNAQAAAKWKAGRLLSKHPKTDIGQDLILGEALEYSNNLNDLIEAKQFMETIAQGLNLDYKELEPRIEDHQQKQARLKQDQTLKRVVDQVEALRREGKIEQATDLLRSSQRDLAPSKVAKEVIRPYTLQDLTRDIEYTQPGLQTGYKDLDKLVTIPQEAITIIAGRPSHGKTTMLLNLLIRMANKYPDKTFLYFSYEETRKQLGIKLLNILSQDVINEAQNLASLEGYLRGGHISRDRIEEGKRQLEELTSGGRVWLIDEPLFVDNLEAVITDMANRYPLGAVFIDYIQKVRIRGKYGARQLEVAAISAKLLDLAKEVSIPIILGAQFGRKDGKTATLKLDNLREAGDIEQDANLVIGLWNDAMAIAEDKNQKVQNRKVNLEAVILKNRNGAVNDTVDLTFDRPILTIADK